MTKRFIRHFPLGRHEAGSAYVANDPWMGAGRLDGFVITTSAFNSRGELVGVFLLHQPPDGHQRHRLQLDATDVFMEGLHPDAQVDRPGRR